MLEWVPFPPPRDLPDPGIQAVSPASPAMSGRFFTTKPPGKSCTTLKVKVLVTQSRLILCDPMGCSPPGSFLHGILQARILEWVFTPFSRGSSQLMDRTHISYGSCIAGRFFTTEPQGKPHSSLYWFSKSTVAPKAHRFRLIVGI